MAAYFLDTEFNGFGGELLSLALVRDDGESLYLIYDRPKHIEPWVAENVIPILGAVPSGTMPLYVTPSSGAMSIARFLAGDPHPYIVTDWPDDVRYFCQAVITGPGMMAPIAALRFDVLRVDAYPTTLQGAVQHNALWDALALRQRLAPRGSAAGVAPVIEEDGPGRNPK